MSEFLNGTLTTSATRVTVVMGLFDFFRGKAPPAISGTKGGAPEKQHATRHCFVLCRASEPSDLSHVSKVVAQVFGPGYSGGVAKDNLVTVMRGESTVGFLAHISAPIPNHEAEENADGNFLWPNGKVEAAEHRSHVIVTNMGGEDQTPIQSAITVSLLALASLTIFDGIGVYWGNASVCNSRKQDNGDTAYLYVRHLQ